jgi:predicted ATPase/DNA-binding SARP family transcriptional activator
MDASSVREPRLRIHLFGGCRIELDGHAVRLETTKTAALLAYLALQDQPQTRQKLVGVFWGDQPDPSARRNLRHALWNIRRVLERPDRPPVIRGEQHTVAFNHADDTWLDVLAFRQRMTQAADIRATPAAPDNRFGIIARALDLYRGDLLEGVAAGDSPEFDDWLLVERERLRVVALEALQRLLAHSIAWGEYETGLCYARRLLELEPWLEDAHRQTMRLLAARGERTAALAQYNACRRVLNEELNVEPSPETQALAESIRAAAEDAARPAPSAARRRNLPPQATPFVGREDELAMLGALLGDPACRLVTLVGPGGIGKTRLAVRASAESGGFSDGVCFVPLAGVPTSDLLVSVIADALGLRFRLGASPRAQLLEYLRDQELLLVLDNLEHLLAGTTLVGEILDAAPGVVILGTSRERLNRHDERAFPVDGLPYPPLNEDADAPESYAAVRLFVQSARRARLGFALDAENAWSVARVCQLVRGMPLAIELAASWARHLSCREVLERLEEGADLLEAESGDLPARHRSMRGVFERSWLLLSDGERRAFGRLSVFRGGFTPDGAREVAGADHDQLAGLVDKSFLRRDPAGRYHVHEVLRQYGEKKLTPADLTTARDAHCRHFADFLQARREDLLSSRTKDAVDAIDTETENVRAGWDWASRHGQTEALRRSLVPICRYFEVRSHFHEGEAALESAAAAVSQLADDADQQLVLALLYLNQGRFCHRLSSDARANQVLAASLKILRRLGNETFLPAALVELATVRVMRGAYADARDLLEEAVVGLRGTNDRVNALVAKLNLGYVAAQSGAYARAERLLGQALRGFEALGLRDYAAFGLYASGLAAFGRGDLAGAADRFERGLAIYRDVRYPWGIALCLSGLAAVAVRNGDDRQAESLAEEGLSKAREIGATYIAALCLNALGGAAMAKGNLPAARRHFLGAIRVARPEEQLPPLFDALTGVAEVELAEGRSEIAAELLVFVVRHRASAAVGRERARRLLAGLGPRLPAGMPGAPRLGGGTDPLESLVKRLLDTEMTATR